MGNKKWHVGYIYRYYNEEVGKSYIGLTKDVSKRKRAHKRNAENTEKLYTSKFYTACSKYGFDSFKFEILYECKSTTLQSLYKLLSDKEKYFIKKYNSYKEGYNSTKGGESPVKKIRKYNDDNRYYQDVILSNKYKNSKYIACNKITGDYYYEDDINGIEYMYTLIDNYVKGESMWKPTHFDEFDFILIERKLVSDLTNHMYYKHEKGNLNIFDNQLKRVLREKIMGYIFHHILLVLFTVKDLGIIDNYEDIERKLSKRKYCSIDKYASEEIENIVKATSKEIEELRDTL